MKTTVINLFAGPGCGKSTLAAGLFQAMKLRGGDVELVREYAKNWAWENRKPSKYDQVYFFGKQVRNESLLYGKVKYIVTDSPILLSAYYEKKEIGTEILLPSVLGVWKQPDVKRVNFFLERHKPYVQKGRFQSETEAREIDKDLRKFLIANQVNFVTLTCKDDNRIANVLKYLGIDR